jgi:RHS repeat-associated protein
LEGGSSFRPGDLGLPTTIIPPDLETEVIHLNYDEREQLITRTRGGSQSEKRSYDVNGNLVRIASAVDGSRERVVTSHYEQNGFLRSTTVHDIEVDGTGLTSLETKYDPDPLYRVARVTYPGGRVVQFADFDHLGHPKTVNIGKYVEHRTYDVHGNVLTVEHGGATDGFGYDGFDRLKTKTVANGESPEKIDFTYHPNGELATLTANGLTGLNRDTSWDVDSLGRRIKQIIKGDSNPRTLQWRYLALETRETEVATGEERSTTYDRAGRTRTRADSTRTLTQTYSPNGNLEVVGSDEHGLSFKTTLHYDELDHLLRGEDLGGQIFHQEVRADGAATRIFNAVEGRTDVAYTLLGERLGLTRPNLVQFRYGWNEQRRLVSARDSRDIGQKSHFDTQFRLNSSTLQDGTVATYSAEDLRSNQLRDSSGSGVQIHRTFDEKGRLTARDVNFRGDLRAETYTYDALDRPVDATFPNGAHNFSYDLLGPAKKTTLTAAGLQYEVGHTIRADGAITRLNYPAPESLSVDLGRDSAGRLQTVTPLGPAPVVSFTAYAAADLVGSQLWGGTNLIKVDTRFNARGRVIGRQYTRMADQVALVDLRYSYDPLNDIIARQQMERAGRAEIFLYDAGARLIGAHYGARGKISGEALRVGYSPFDLPALPSGNNPAPGFYSRGYQYDLQSGLDILLTVPEVNPDRLPVITFGLAFTGFDAFLLPQSVDGFQIGKDELGNVTRARLMAWNLGDVEPHATPATLRYNGLNNLLSVTADTGGVSVNYEYDEEGLLLRRTLLDPRLPGGTAQSVFVWDDARLLAEFDRTAGNNKLKARYYYFASDVPVAMDQRQADGQLHRFYLLSDALGSIVALTDDRGVVISRYQYDAWGQFRPEGPDRQPPYVRRIVATQQSFQLEFNEAVLPPVSSSSFPALELGPRSFGDVAEVRVDGTVVGGSWRYLDQGSTFGATLQFLASKPILGSVQVHIKPGVSIDSWNNPNLDQTYTFAQTATTATGAVLASNDVAEVPAGPVVLPPFLFQGQLFDSDVGLYYLRARQYDPYLGRFLQRDPVAYLDSPNLYAAFGNNPTTMRDPSGTVPGSRTPGSGPRVPFWHEPTEELPLPVRSAPTESAAPPASPRPSNAPVARGNAAPVVDRAPMANKPVDNFAPATAQTQARIARLPATEKPSAARLARLEAEGRDLMAHLDQFEANAKKAGTLKTGHADLESGAPQGDRLQVKDGRFVHGRLAQHYYNPETKVSTVAINQDAARMALQTPEGSIMRKQIKIAYYHELMHAENAMNMGGPAPRGAGSFLEELGVHESEIAIEYALFGRENPATKSAVRRTFENTGSEGVANYLMSIQSYRLNQFQVTTREQAAAMLRPHGFYLRF